MTTTPALSVNALLLVLVAELRDEDVADPLNERFTLAALWADLARLAGEPLPAAVAAVLDAPLDLAPVSAYRGSYAEHSAQFPAYAD